VPNFKKLAVYKISRNPIMLVIGALRGLIDGANKNTYVPATQKLNE